MEEKSYKNGDYMPMITFGYDENNVEQKLALKKVAHICISGPIASGKTYFLKNVIENFYISKNKNMELTLIDTKGIEFGKYKYLDIVQSILCKEKEVFRNLNKIVKEIQSRFSLFCKNEVADIESYNNLEKNKSILPYKVIIFDEIIDYLQNKRTVNALDYILRVGRGAGVYLIVATQRIDLLKKTKLYDCFPTQISTHFNKSNSRNNNRPNNKKDVSKNRIEIYSAVYGNEIKKVQSV